jgi:hypothetical protein
MVCIVYFALFSSCMAGFSCHMAIFFFFDPAMRGSVSPPTFPANLSRHVMQMGLCIFYFILFLPQLIHRN